MVTKARPPRPAKRKAPVLRLIPSNNKALSADCLNVAAELKRALGVAQSGVTTGAVVITLHQEGHWSAELAGQLAYDRETLGLIVGHLLGTCLMTR